MSDDHWENDESGEIDRPSNKADRRSHWRPVLWVSGGGLALVGVVVALVLAWPTVQRAMTPVVAQHRSAAEQRSEAAAAFGGFDPAAGPTAGLSPAERTERAEILALFQQMETATRAGDEEATLKLVDLPRLFTRIKQTGRVVGWSLNERRDFQVRVTGSCTPDGFYAHVQLVAIVPVADDAGTRVVYALAHDEAQDDQNEVRFWIARHGRTWKVYDWERLDVGMSKSQEWAAIAWHTKAGTLGDFDLRSAAIAKLKRQIEAGEHAAARTTLVAIERLRCPADFTDTHLTVNGYYWLWLHANDEAARSFEKVSHPEDVPGAWYGLMLARQWSHPQQALANALQYEAALGAKVSLCETKAQILVRLGRKSEAAADWRKILRSDANHDAALTGLLLLLPEQDKSAFAEHLDKTTAPVQTAAKLAPMIAWRDEAALSFLIDYIRARRPESPEVKSLTAMKHSAAGDHALAAETHLQLLLAETDAAKQRSHASSYLSAMTELGRIVEGFDALPSAVQPAAFDRLANEFFEDESDLSRDEFEQVLAHFRQRHPDNLRAVVHVVGLAVRDKRFDEAERDARAALKRLDEQASKNGGITPPAREPPDEQGADDNDDNLRISLRYHLAKALCHLGRVDEAWELLPAESRFQQLAWIVEGDGPSDRLRELIQLQTVSQPADPEISYYRGRLDERAGRTDEAIAEYRQALAKAAGKPLGKYQYALRHLFVITDRWLEFYESPSYDDTQLESLADELVRLRKWQSFDELMNRHLDPKGRTRLAAVASEAAWERQRYADCAELCFWALKSPDSGLQEWQRGTVRTRQLVSLLRQKKFDEAQTLAARFRDDNAEPLAPAVVSAAAGNFADALSIALTSTVEGGSVGGSAISLYQHSEVGGIFLRDEFASLHEKLPVELPYVVSSETALVLLKSPSEIDERQLATIVQQAVSAEPNAPEPNAPPPTIEVQVLTAHDPGLRAYRVGFGSAGLWLVAGTGRFDSTWSVAESASNDSPEQAALRAAVIGSNGYLLIGTVGWTTSDRERLSDLARRVARRLAGPSTVAIQLGQTFQLHAPDDTLLDLWQATNSIGERTNPRALTLEYKPVDTVAATRQFQNELVIAARAFKPDQSAPLEIIVTAITDPVLDPVTIRVTKVTRLYNTFAFEGVVKSPSLTLPELRTGLPVNIRQHQVQAWRSGDTDFHWRP